MGRCQRRQRPRELSRALSHGSYGFLLPVLLENDATNQPTTAVGRWQKGKDLTWYAKGDSDTTLTPEQQRLVEIKRIKEAEQDALSEALGFKVVRRHTDAVDQDEVRRAIKESGVGDQPEGW